MGGEGQGHANPEGAKVGLLLGSDHMPALSLVWCPGLASPPATHQDQHDSAAPLLGGAARSGSGAGGDPGGLLPPGDGPLQGGRRRERAPAARSAGGRAAPQGAPGRGGGVLTAPTGVLLHSGAPDWQAADRPCMEAGSGLSCAPASQLGSPPLPSCQALEERRALEDYLSAGEALLARAPASAEEIGAAGAEARTLVARLAELAQVRGVAAACWGGGL